MYVTIVPWEWERDTAVLFRGSLWERLQRDRLPEAWLKTPNALGIGRWTPMTQANERLRA